MASWYDIRKGISEITAPAAEPLALSEAKSFLRIDNSDQDTLITELIKTARQRVENDTGQSLVNTTWDYWFDTFPTERSITLSRVPLVSVTHVKSYNEDDTESTLASSTYLVDTIQNRVALNDGDDWPGELREFNAGIIRFVAGHGTAGSDVPSSLRLACYQLLTHWFEHADPYTSTDAVSNAYAGHIAAYRNSAGIA
mgnify:CR=1 FL=1